MLNKLLAFAKSHRMLEPGDHVVCAVSGGADSVALLFAMYLLAPRLNITLSAAHYNHQLRGEESQADADFVVQVCRQYEIPLHMASGKIQPGKKGLEAAAREARYSFFDTLPGKIATAHTADDNLETVLMHLVRGTDLKGLGGIAPVRGKVIRPMLQITRAEILSFLAEYHLTYVTDSSNDEDVFFRNRLRHHVVPLLKEENPKLAQNVSQMALRLREDEMVLEGLTGAQMPSISQLSQMPPALRRRYLHGFLAQNGVPEPEASHISLAEKLVFSQNPSAKGNFPGGVVIARNYDVLQRQRETLDRYEIPLPCPGSVDIPALGIRVSCAPAEEVCRQVNCFCVKTTGPLTVRSRQAGDCITGNGGTKTLKRWFVDRKIPAIQRSSYPVICDKTGIVGLYGFGGDINRLTDSLPCTKIWFSAL